MRLAVNGGKPVTSKFLPVKKFYDKELVKERVCKIIDSEFLSGHRGSMGPGFWGGEHVRHVESQFEEYLQSGDNTVLAVNSCTSALIVACGAIGLKPGDEVIVTPWSMSCSATAPLMYGATPVFADIEKEYFCLDPESIEEKITEKTKAIIVVDLFGQSYNAKAINAIAKKHGLFIIEDAAQAIGGHNNDEWNGLLGDISCFSFTQGKHLTCGEGGFIVTRNREFYEKSALLRNHSDAVISSAPDKYSKYLEDGFYKLPGNNLRMTEIQASILSVQLESIDKEVSDRNERVRDLVDEIKIPGIEVAKTRKDCRHAYYVLPFHYNKDQVGVPRDVFTEAVKAELAPDKFNININLTRGVPLWNGYINPLYKMPIFKDRKIKPLPNTEYLQNEDLFITLLHGFDLDTNQIDMVAEAFNKVYRHREELK